jgi:hypothetical protein
VNGLHIRVVGEVRSQWDGCGRTCFQNDEELSRNDAVGKKAQKKLRQDEQDEQDEIPKEIAITKWGSDISRANRFFHPVNPVHPVKFPLFNCMVPAQSQARRSRRAIAKHLRRSRLLLSWAEVLQKFSAWQL